MFTPAAMAGHVAWLPIATLPDHAIPDSYRADRHPIHAPFNTPRARTRKCAQDPFVSPYDRRWMVSDAGELRFRCRRLIVELEAHRPYRPVSINI